MMKLQGKPFNKKGASIYVQMQDNNNKDIK